MVAVHFSPMQLCPTNTPPRKERKASNMLPLKLVNLQVGRSLVTVKLANPLFLGMGRIDGGMDNYIQTHTITIT